MGKWRVKGDCSGPTWGKLHQDSKHQDSNVPVTATNRTAPWWRITVYFHTGQKLTFWLSKQVTVFLPLLLIKQRSFYGNVAWKRHFEIFSSYPEQLGTFKLTRILNMKHQLNYCDMVMTSLLTISSTILRTLPSPANQLLTKAANS